MSTEFFTHNLLPVAISLMVLWVAYRLLFTNSNRFQFNRFYLLTAMLFSLALPLFGLLMGQSSPQVVALKQNLLGGFMLKEITISYGDPTAVTLPEVEVAPAARIQVSLWQVLGIIYLIGVAVTALLFLFKMGKLVYMIIRSPKRKMDGYTMVFTHKEHGPYSFFRYAFFPDEQVDPDIVRHELSHIAHHHSWDILMAELMKIFQWFNPFIYLYKRELQSLHEYSADHDVVATGVDKRNYMMLILQQCTAVDFSDMSNNFSLILTKKRIKMITKNEKARRLWWRLLATIPVLAVLLIANTKVTAQEKKAVDDNPKLTIEMGEFEIFDDDGTPLQFKDTVIYNPDGSYIKCDVTDAFDPLSGEPCRKMTITTFNADETPNYNFNIKETYKHGDTVGYMVEPFSISLGEGHATKISSDDLKVKIVPKDTDSIYNIVEVMPEFPGGMNKMAEFLSENIKYPEKAKDNGVSGRVFISFVIEKDGSVSNIEVMKGIGGGCDDEAVRVVKAMPKWKPGLMKGKPVRVHYVLPVNFQLEESAKTAKKSDEKIYEAPETMPEYVGGMDAMIKYLQENITVPEKYQNMEARAQYRVMVKFVVEADGSVTEVETVKPEPAKKDLNDEAVRVVKGMPKWKPGTMDGKPVRVRYILPVTYKLGK